MPQPLINSREPHCEASEKDPSWYLSDWMTHPLICRKFALFQGLLRGCCLRCLMPPPGSTTEKSKHPRSGRRKAYTFRVAKMGIRKNCSSSTPSACQKSTPAVHPAQDHDGNVVIRWDVETGYSLASGYHLPNHDHEHMVIHLAEILRRPCVHLVVL